MNRLRPVVLSAVIAGLAACSTVGPDYAVPDHAAARRPAANAGFVDTGNDRVQPGAPLPARWWALYQDPLLDGLIEQALRDNSDLKVAGANLRRAAAVYEQALDAGGVEYTADAGASRAQLSAQAFLQREQLPVLDLADGKFGVSYQLDLFGKLQRGAEAAHADTEAAQAAIDLARVNVAAQVAASYVEICNANHELGVAEHALQVQQRSRTVAQRMIAAGRATPPDLARATAQVATLEAALPPLRARRQAAGYQLAALLGKTPGEVPPGVDRCAHAPSPQQPIPIGDGRALLARRPDVRQAERRLAAATARIGVATAELYPEIRLGGSIGATGQLADIGEAATRAWSFGPLLAWTLPSCGAHARVRASEAGADAALAQFDGAVLQALREVQTALSRYAQDLDRLHLLQQAQQQAALAAAQNRQLYQGGRAPYLSSLDAERSLAVAEISLAQIQAQVAQDQVQLFLALGGGWEGATIAPTAAP
ncbi:efflux transporter outer membrane subunit [Xanthomonas melonis]|uniref:RND transporter n=1 Tax=Xanthomonas melonis TaxID=56456 RepID=A0A2S7DC90_9XANT|nr:efflux transporter outer membrane subunit [Xanthomonas melonis]MCC4602077.1 efflux transporter outer membrane subunit [Xanthomonas melonis]PPU71448.1 RND transporter [Xanthomonas melonis]